MLMTLHPPPLFFKGWVEEKLETAHRFEDPALHVSSARAGLDRLKCVVTGNEPYAYRVGKGSGEGAQAVQSVLELENVEVDVLSGGDDDDDDGDDLDEGFGAPKQRALYRSQVPPHVQPRAPAHVHTPARSNAFAARQRRQPVFQTRSKRRAADEANLFRTRSRDRITSSSSADSALGDDAAVHASAVPPLSANSGASRSGAYSNQQTGFQTRTYSPWGGHEPQPPMRQTNQAVPTTWIPLSSGLESQRLPFLQTRLMSHTHAQKRNLEPTPPSVTGDTFRHHGIEAYARPQLAMPNGGDPYRRHHPGARNTATGSTSESYEKGTLVRRTILPNGDAIQFAPGYDSSRCESPEDALFKQTNACGSQYVGARGASSNPNPAYNDREHWQVAATNRLAGTSLRHDPAKKVWPGVTGVVSGLNYYTSDVALVSQKMWALDRLNAT